MDLLSKSDAELLSIAEPLYDQNVIACNSKNWQLFAKNMPPEQVTSEIQKEVEEQWENVPFLTALSDKKQHLGILRREKSVHVLWKQWSTASDMEYLGVQILVEHNSEVKVKGFFFK